MIPSKDYERTFVFITLSGQHRNAVRVDQHFLKSENILAGKVELSIPLEIADEFVLQFKKAVEVLRNGLV